MILIERRSHKSNGAIEVHEDVHVDSFSALATLAIELKKGGCPDEGRGRVSVSTPNGEYTDRVTFKGHVEDMRRLRLFLYFQMQGAGLTTLAPNSDEETAMDPRLEKIHPSVFPLLREHRHRVEVAAMLACEIEPGDILRHVHHPIDEIITVASFHRDGHYSSFREAFADLAV